MKTRAFVRVHQYGAHGLEAPALVQRARAGGQQTNVHEPQADVRANGCMSADISPMSVDGRGVYADAPLVSAASAPFQAADRPLRMSRFTLTRRFVWRSGFPGPRPTSPRSQGG